MNNAANERIGKLTQALDQLPENYCAPALFIAKHYDFFEEMCRVEPLTEVQREAFMEDAIRKDDAMLILLLMMERRVNGGESR